MFKVGDKVKFVKNICENNKYLLGQTGEITEVFDYKYPYQTTIPGAYLYCDEELELVIEKPSRGFENITGYSTALPQRKTSSSAGYDLCVITGSVVSPGCTVVFETGLKAYMEPDEYLSIHIRSSVGMKRKLMLGNITGIIDADYYNNEDNEGHIMIALYNYGTEPQVIRDGERVAQGIFQKYLKVDGDETVAPRVGGIGSTGVQ